MYKLEFTLKQHTPIIHFQHDQDGATLRASEVKPKLDKYIIKKYGGEVHSDWYNGKVENHSLDYKLRIITITEPFSTPINYDSTPDGKFRPKFPCVFGN